MLVPRSSLILTCLSCWFLIKTEPQSVKPVLRKELQILSFNEKLEWEIPLEEATRRKLEISVKNNVSFMSREKELIGKVIIDLSQVDLSKGVNQWYELKNDRSSGV